MPPNGGFGGNTGIHDGHNLAWKLALVLKGVAGPQLLTHTRLSVVRWGSSRRAGVHTVRDKVGDLSWREGFSAAANDFNIELGYIYRSPAIIAEDDVERGSEDPHESLGRPGSRAPHLWIDKDGQRISTLDLFGRGFVLLTRPGGSNWVNASRVAARQIAGLDFDAHVIRQTNLQHRTELATTVQ
jgi:hypothetical protein